MKHLDKIKKLLALAQDPSAAPNEAETAARQAAALMAKYNIELSHLEQAELEKEWDITEQGMPGCRPGKKNPQAVPAWIGIMAYGVKVYTRTRCISHGGYVIYRGPRQEVELAQWMLKALIDLAYKGSRSSSDPSGYRNGFASAIQRRLKAMTQDRDNAEQGSTALVVADKLQAKLDELYGPEVRRTSNTRPSAEGYAAGNSANLPTGRPISNSAALRLTAH